MEGLCAVDVEDEAERARGGDVLVVPGALAVDLQDGGGVADALAEVGGPPQRDELAAPELLVAVEAQVVAADEGGEAVGVEEAGEDVAAEGRGEGLGVPGAARELLGGLGPQHVVEGALGAGLGEARDDADLVDGLEGGAGDAAVEG